MRIGLVAERKLEVPLTSADPADLDSELLSQAELDELESAIRDAGHEVLFIGSARLLLNRIGYWRRRCDLVFNRSVGYRGIERRTMVPAILEAAGIPYLGSTPYVVTLVQHKYHTKLVAAAAGVHTPPCVLVTRAQHSELESLPYPAIVKPLAESASLGIDSDNAVVHDAEAAASRAKHILKFYHQPALVESFIYGAEVEVPLLIDSTPRALGVVGMTLNGALLEGAAFLSSDTVYGDSYGFATPPSYVPIEQVASDAVRVAEALGLRDYGRVDFRVTEDGVPWMIEANVHPHLLRHSSFYYLAQLRGLAHSAMLEELIQIAAQRQHVNV